MSECPEIAVYEQVSGPPVSAFTGRFVVTKTSAKTGAVWNEFLPIIFSGASIVDVIQKAEAFWRDEQAKIEARKFHGAQLGASRRKAIQPASGQGIADLDQINKGEVVLA